MRPEGRSGAHIGTDKAHRLALGRDGGDHRLDAEDVEGAAQIVGERRQAELGAHVGERCALVEEDLAFRTFGAASEGLGAVRRRAGSRQTAGTPFVRNPKRWQIWLELANIR